VAIYENVAFISLRIRKRMAVSFNMRMFYVNLQLVKDIVVPFKSRQQNS